MLSLYVRKTLNVRYWLMVRNIFPRSPCHFELEGSQRPSSCPTPPPVSPSRWWLEEKKGQNTSRAISLVSDDTAGRNKTYLIRNKRQRPIESPFKSQCFFSFLHRVLVLFTEKARKTQTKLFEQHLLRPNFSDACGLQASPLISFSEATTLWASVESLDDHVCLSTLVNLLCFTSCAQTSQTPRSEQGVWDLPWT